MATTAQTLVNRCRRFTDDWPESDTLTASVSSGGTTITVADGTRYIGQELIEIDQEVMRVTATGSGTSATVQRAMRGTTAATHATGTTVLFRPAFYAISYFDALNEALAACFPRLYRPISLDFTGTLADTYEYTLPNMSGLAVPIPYISTLQYKPPGGFSFKLRREWEVVRSESPYLKFRAALTAGGTLRINGYGPFTPFVALADVVDTYFPVNAEPLLPLYAAGVLLQAGEARRVRMDAGAIDAREQATRPGVSMAAGQALIQRFMAQLERAAMPPPPKSVKVSG